MMSWLLQSPDLNKFPRFVAEARLHSLLIARCWLRDKFGTGNRTMGVTSVAAFQWSR